MLYLHLPNRPRLRVELPLLVGQFPDGQEELLPRDVGQLPDGQSAVGAEDRISELCRRLCWAINSSRVYLLTES